jgi:hypothetical protein
LIYGLVQAVHDGHTIVPLALGAVLLGGFVWRALHTPDPLIDLELFGARSFSAADMAVMVGAFHDLRAEQIPHASSTTRIAQQLGGAFGTAVLAVILQRQLTGHDSAAAFDTTFWWVLEFTAVAVVPALLLPRRETLTAAGPGTATGRVR